MTEQEIRDRIDVLLNLGAVGNVYAWVAEVRSLTAEYKRLVRPQGAYLDGEWFGGYYGGK
jgi:hypothetical protein